MIYVVLGMHKSGTSLVAEILHRSGIPMVEGVDDGLDYDSGNKWERASTASLNKHLLGAEGVHSLDLEPPSTDLLEEKNLESVRELVRGIEGPDWGFKDPRTCLTWPLWREAIGEHRVIAVYRHYAAVAAHGVRWPERHHRRGLAWRYRVTRRAIERWIEHNERVLTAAEEAGDDAIVMSYESLMGPGDELERLAAFVGRELVDPREPERYRHRTRGDLRTRLASRALQLAGRGSAEGVLEKLEEASARSRAKSPAPVA